MNANVNVIVIVAVAVTMIVIMFLSSEKINSQRLLPSLSCPHGAVFNIVMMM